jgi:hypothetical protein
MITHFRHTTLGRTPLDEGPARRRDLYLTTHNTHKRQTSMSPVEFEPTILVSERPKTHALDRKATGIGTNFITESILKYTHFHSTISYLNSITKSIMTNIFTLCLLLISLFIIPGGNVFRGSWPPTITLFCHLQGNIAPPVREALKPVANPSLWSALILGSAQCSTPNRVKTSRHVSLDLFRPVPHLLLIF